MNHKRRSSSTLRLTVILAGLVAADKAAHGAVQPGIYVGWAYLDDGGDFPLRLEYKAADGDPTVYLSLPHRRAYGIPTTDVRTEDEEIRFTRRNPDSEPWEYTAVRTGNRLSGTATRAKDRARFTFELHPAPEPLVMRPPRDHREYTGTYHDANGRTVVVSAWFWGELRCFDTTSGRTGTLFETTRGDFILGSGMYVPRPVFARLRFERSAAGKVTHLLWSQAEGDTRQLERLSVKEQIVAFENDGARLEGMLVTPEGRGPFPLVVVLGGSDWRTHAQVRREADIFVSFGLAALVYDKRGHGRSNGDPVRSFRQTAEDACAAIHELEKRPEIDPNRIGIFGVSRGGWLAPLAAVQCSNDVSFLVLFVAPAVSPARQETTRRLNAMRDAGFTAAEVKEAARYLERLFAATESDEAWNAYLEEQARLEDHEWFDIVREDEKRGSDDYRWSKLNMQYDPVPTLEQVTCPVLALFGGRDRNVTPDPNLPLMRTALKRAGNDDVTFKVLKRADHGLRPAEPGVAIPLHRTVGYVPQVWTTVHDWLADRSLIKAER